MTNSYEAYGPEAEFEPGSRRRVLRNLLRIRSASVMEDEESLALVGATRRMSAQTARDHRFTAADICYLHRLWLGEIYPWAGEYRSVVLAKDGFPFAFPSQIPRLMNEFEAGPLAQYTPCGAGSAFAEALATVHAELVLIHPFREGNGRVARFLAILMALQAGLPALRFEVFDEDSVAYIGAIHAWMRRSSPDDPTLRTGRFPDSRVGGEAPVT